MSRIKFNLFQLAAMIGSILFLFLTGSLLLHNPSFSTWGSALVFLCFMLFPVLLIVSVYGIECLHESIVLSSVKNRIVSFVERYPEEIKIFCAAIGFRIIFYLFSVVVMAVMGDYSGGITFSDFLEVWKRWDSQHYLNIAENGYAGAIENGEHIFLVFYPLLPWLLRCLGFFFHDMRFCGILLSTICYGIGCIYLYKNAKTEFDKETALTATVAISVFPFGFFFGSIMTESLFLAIASAFLYYVRQHKWSMVAILGFLACLTKVQGLLLTFAVLVELFYSESGVALLRGKKWRDFLHKVLSPVVRLLSCYLALSYIF